MTETDNIKFDFAKTSSLLGILNDCSHGLSELSSTLGSEITSAGQWWKGLSYDEFEGKYSGSGRSKSAIEALTDRTADINGYLSKVSNAKKDFERNSSNLFK